MSFTYSSRKENEQTASLPCEVLEKILTHLSYAKIAQLRTVSSQFNSICSNLLNKGFRFTTIYFNENRASMPNYWLLNRLSSDLLELNKTFSNYIDMKLCCFIPGKVLDVLLASLHCIQKEDLANKTDKWKTIESFISESRILHELRSNSLSAREHFQEVTAPFLIAQKLLVEQKLCKKIEKQSKEIHKLNTMILMQKEMLIRQSNLMANQEMQVEHLTVVNRLLQGEGTSET